MSGIIYIILGCAAAYLLGSIPTAVWAGKWFYGIDIREHGSKNAGATNTFRVLGKKPGIIVFLIDTLKGFSCVMISKLPLFDHLSPEWHNLLQIFLGLTGVAGHIFPVWAQFRGGKGVATTLGLVLALHPYSGLTALGIFAIVFFISGYVSLGSVTAGISYPFLVIFVFSINIFVLQVFSIIMSLLLIFTHRKNIDRLLHGTENRFSFRKKNTDSIGENLS